MARMTLIGVAALLLLSGEALWEGSFEDGIAARQRGSNPEAIKRFRAGAIQGDARAQAMLGVMYYNGDGTAQNFAEAAKWLQLSAAQGIRSAQFLLGRSYRMGNGMA